MVQEYDGHSKGVDKVVDRIHSEVDSTLLEVIGATEIDLIGERIPCRTGETGMGDLVCDVMRDSTGADIAVINGGAFRASIVAGEVTKGDVYSAFPFENQLITKRFDGSMIWQMMEHSVSAFPSAGGFFLQVSGMEVVFDSSLPAGNRVVSIAIGGSPISLDSTYLLASNDYVITGGDGYDILSGVPAVGQYSLVSDRIIEWIGSQEAVNEPSGGRLTDLNTA